MFLIRRFLQNKWKIIFIFHGVDSTAFKFLQNLSIPLAHLIIIIIIITTVFSLKSSKFPQKFHLPNTQLLQKLGRYFYALIAHQLRMGYSLISLLGLNVEQH